MTIRPKVIALVASMLVVLGIVQIVVEQHILMPSFAELERDDARTAMRRIDYALDLTLERLGLSAADWGNWEDTYRFVDDHNANYVRANVTIVGLKQLQINAMLVIDLQGNIVMSRTLDLGTEQPLDIDFAARKSLPADFPWRANLRAGRPARGFLQTNLGVMMIAAAPVLDGNGGGPPRGMVMLGRLLSAIEIQRIAAQAQALLTMAPATRASGASGASGATAANGGIAATGATAATAANGGIAATGATAATAATGVPGDSEPGQLVETAQFTQVFSTVNDVYGQPLTSLRVDVPRRITQRGHAAIAYASICLLAAAIVVLLLLLLVLNRVVLMPLAHMTRHAVAIGGSEDLSARLNFQRGDEIGRLAVEFDRMVERVAESRRQLVDQSFQAGFAELARGVLHNLGNAMTPIGVRLAALGQRLRQAPTIHAEQAALELQGGTVEPVRRADLQEFLRLACGEFAVTIRAAQQDVAVLTRQTGIVQSALSDQMRSSRNEHVIESVRLPELLAQSLEVVPDACRQRLTIQADESLGRIGVVQVARTVLRLVLQNLIINASDAVRDAGKDQGMLRLSARIAHDAGRDYLHLQCQDDGVGIAAANLDRVFEKGFSTKPTGSNYGIGLHWCSNAIGALGGRIWAASDGPGLGASIHIRLPLVARAGAAAVQAA